MDAMADYSKVKIIYDTMMISFVDYWIKQIRQIFMSKLQQLTSSNLVNLSLFIQYLPAFFFTNSKSDIWYRFDPKYTTIHKDLFYHTCTFPCLYLKKKTHFIKKYVFPLIFF